MKNIFKKGLAKNKKIQYVCLSLTGAIVTISGLIFNPYFVASHFSPDGMLDRLNIVRVLVLEVLAVSFGLIVLLYSLTKTTNIALADKAQEKIETNLIRPWNRYWFAPTSLRRLAIFRILFFSYLILDSLFMHIPGCIEGLKNASPEFFKPLLLIRVLHLGSPPSPFVLDIIHNLLILFAIGATVGFRTRFCMLGSVSLYVYITGMWWSFEGIHHSDEIFIFAMTALLLSSCGKVLSVDEVLTRIGDSKRRGKFQRERTERLESEYALWPMRLIQVLIALIYFNAAYWKLKLAGLSWVDGVTLQFHLIRHYFVGQYVSDVGLLISKSPILCKLLSVSTLVFELGFPLILIFPRLAWIWLPAGLLFHIGSGITMDTWFFLFWFCYIAFINFETLALWVRDKLRIPYNSPELKVLFDGACPLCIRSMTIIAYLDWLKRIEFVDLSNWEQIVKSYPSLNREEYLREMHVIDKNSKVHKGFFAYRYIAKYIPILWIVLPLLYIPVISIIGDSVYRRIASRRTSGRVACTIHNCR